MEPARKLQKISHRRKITITALALKTDRGIQHVYACSACKQQFETVALASSHLVEHKKRGRANGPAEASGLSGDIGMDTTITSSGSIQEENNSSHRDSKRTLNSSPKQGNSSQVLLEKECVGQSTTAINSSDSVCQATELKNGTDYPTCNANKQDILTKLLCSDTRKYARICPTKKSDEFILKSKNDIVEFQVAGKSDSCSDTDDASEDVTNGLYSNLSDSDTEDGTNSSNTKPGSSNNEDGTTYTKVGQDGRPFDTTAMGNCAVVLEKLENTRAGRYVLRSWRESNSNLEQSSCTKVKEQEQTVPLTAEAIKLKLKMKLNTSGTKVQEQKQTVPLTTDRYGKNEEAIELKLTTSEHTVPLTTDRCRQNKLAVNTSCTKAQEQKQKVPLTTEAIMFKLKSMLNTSGTKLQEQKQTIPSKTDSCRQNQVVINTSGTEVQEQKQTVPSKIDSCRQNQVAINSSYTKAQEQKETVPLTTEAISLKSKLNTSGMKLQEQKQAAPLSLRTDRCRQNQVGINTSCTEAHKQEQTVPLTTDRCGQNEEAIGTLKSYACTLCSLTFSRILCYANHLLMYHHPLYEKNKIARCPICPINYNSYYNSLKIHMAKKHNLSEMQCLKCKERFETCSSLFTHIHKCKVDIPRISNISCFYCNGYHILGKGEHSREDVEMYINEMLKHMPEEKTAAKMRIVASIITENVAKKSALPIFKCRQCKITFTESSCCVNHIAGEHAEMKLFKDDTMTGSNSSIRHVCERCGKKHVLLDRDVGLCVYELEQAGVFSRDMRKGGIEKIDEYDANFPCTGSKPNEMTSHTKPNGDHTDIKSQRLECLKRFFDFDKTVYSAYDHGRGTIVDITSFDLIYACTKEEVGNDMVHRIEQTDQGYECAICLDQFLEYGCCKSHVLTIHHTNFLYTIGSEVYTCPVCAVSYHNIFRFEQHLEFHGVFKYYCKKCNLLFNNSFLYQIHLKHSKPEILTDKSYSCSSCGLIHNCVVLDGEQAKIKYKSNENRRKDSKKVSNSSSHFYKSTHKLGSLPKNKQNYVFGRIGFDGDSYVCLECKKTYHDFECCSSHIVIQHVNLEMTCLICNKLFYSRLSMNTHLKTDHQIETFLYCPCCFESFSVEGDLTKHRQKCTVKRFNKVLENRLCKTCCQLHVDIGIRMPDVNECHKCQNGFVKLSCYNNHYYKEHYQCQIALLSKYCCFQCPDGRQFLKLNHVYEHIHEIHNNTGHGEASQGTDRSSQMDIPLPEESFNIDFDVRLKDSKDKSKSKNKQCSSSTSGLDHCSHCCELHVTQSEAVQMGSSSSKRRCEVCKVSFKSAKCLKNHMAVEHGGKRMVYQCVICSKWFSSLKLLEFHQGRTEHSEVDTEHSEVDAEHSEIDTEHSKVDAEHSKVDAEHSKVDADYSKVDAQHSEVDTEHSKVDTGDRLSESSAQSVTNDSRVDNTMERRVLATIGIPIHKTGRDASKANKQLSVSVDRSGESGQCKEEMNSSCTDISKLTCTDCSTVHVNKFDETEKKIITGNIFDAIDFKFEKKQITKSEDLYLESSCCTVCGEECGSMSDLYKHILEIHVTIKFIQGEITHCSKEAYMCNYCPEKFRCSMDAQLHLRAYHNEKPLRIIRNKEKDEMIRAAIVVCPVCFMAVEKCKKTTIKDHLKTHFKKLALFVCDSCGKSFSCRDTLKNHVSIQHTDQRAQHKCTVCGKCFNHMPNLISHRKIHMEKKEACPVCGMKFTLRAHVRAHVKRKH